MSKSIVTDFTVALMLSLSGSLFGANLSAPYLLENSQVLPRGVRNPRFLNFSTNMETKYDGSGQTEPLGNRLNRQVTWNDVIDSQSDETQKNLVRALVQEGEIKTNGPGQATGVVNTYANAKIPILAWGISDRITMALAVPIVSVDVNVSTGFVGNPSGDKFIEVMGRSSPERAVEAAEKLNTAISQKLSRLGYEPLRNHTVSGLGDLQLIGKVRWLGNERSGLASKFTFVMPTGTPSNPDRALDITTGDSRYKAGMLLIYDEPIGPLRWNTQAGYLALLPYASTKRLPTSAEDSLSQDKEVVTRKLGHQAIVSTGLEAPIPSLGLTVGAALNSQHVTGANYTGNSQDSATRARYRYLSDLEPYQSLQAATIHAGFSTIDWYRAKKFALPLQATVMVSHPLGGRNVPKNDVVSGELLLFF